MRFLFLIPMVFLLSCCTKQATIVPMENNNIIHRVVAPFNRIMVEGNINLRIHRGKIFKIDLKGHPADLMQVKSLVSHQTLTLNLGKGYPNYGPVSADIYLPTLNAFSYHGSGTIVADNLYSRSLDATIENMGRTTFSGQINLHKLTIGGEGYTHIRGVSSPSLYIKVKGKSRVELSGVMNVSELDLYDGAWISLHWLKSNSLRICGHGQSFIQLAGIAEKLEVELWDRAHFNGRYLRTNRVFVKTHGKSIAEIAAVKRQHSLATDASDIYFYNLPTMKTDFMAFNGAVLDMRDLSPWDIEEYTRYNK